VNRKAAGGKNHRRLLFFAPARAARILPVKPEHKFDPKEQEDLLNSKERQSLRLPFAFRPGVGGPAWARSPLGVILKSLWR